jgi:hypothetical protein
MAYSQWKSLENVYHLLQPGRLNGLYQIPAIPAGSCADIVFESHLKMPHCAALYYNDMIEEFNVG